MKVGLIDVDSKIPNLALMKISQYHKQLNHTVELTSPLFAQNGKFDLVIASKIFTFSEMPILPKGSIVGGSGIDLKKTIDLIDTIYPDYDLYHCDYAMGFTTRGCNRKCPWCIVPKKEGKFRIIGDIYDFWNGQAQIMLLDNSLNTNENHFLKICDQIERNNIVIDFNQGLDIRYLTDVQAMALNNLRLWKRIHFAWDSMSIEYAVRKGISILHKYHLNHKSMFYVLIGFNTTPDEDLYRIDVLKGLQVDPFVMPYNKFDEYQRRFARWVNHKAIFKSVKWENYKG